MSGHARRAPPTGARAPRQSAANGDPAPRSTCPADRSARTSRSQPLLNVRTRARRAPLSSHVASNSRAGLGRNLRHENAAQALIARGGNNRTACRNLQTRASAASCGPACGWQHHQTGEDGLDRRIGGVMWPRLRVGQQPYACRKPATAPPHHTGGARTPAVSRSTSEPATAPAVPCGRHALRRPETLTGQRPASPWRTGREREGRPDSKRRGWKFVDSARTRPGGGGRSQITAATADRKSWRRRPDSNRGWRFCRPLPCHLATAPSGRRRGRLGEDSRSRSLGGQVQPFERGEALIDLAGGRWSGKRDSNPRLRPWQGRTLPLSYSR